MKKNTGYIRFQGCVDTQYSIQNQSTGTISRLPESKIEYLGKNDCSDVSTGRLETITNSTPVPFSYTEESLELIRERARNLRLRLSENDNNSVRNSHTGKPFAQLIQERSYTIRGRPPIPEKNFSKQQAKIEKKVVQPKLVNLKPPPVPEKPNQQRQQIDKKAASPKPIHLRLSHFEAINAALMPNATYSHKAEDKERQHTFNSAPNAYTVKSYTDLSQDRSGTTRDRPVIPEKPSKLQPKPLGSRLIQLEAIIATPKPVRANWSYTKTKSLDDVREVSHDADTNRARGIVCNDNDLPRLPLQLPRQRMSYAEPRKCSELKSTISFNQIDHVKRQIDHMKEAINCATCDNEFEKLTNELIQSEEIYVQNLQKGIQNYGNIFTRKDLPPGLYGKKFDVLGSIEQITMFHRDTLLPMFLRNQNDLTKLFDEFSTLIDNHHMYCYVMYTMNKSRSLDLLKSYAFYFEKIRLELDEKLGIDSFLLHPIQRPPLYKLFFDNFLKVPFSADPKTAIFFKNNIKACCYLLNKMCMLLETINEAAVIGDIIEWSELKLCNPNNKFRKMLDLYISDGGHNLNYASKVFIFDKFMIYTEIQGTFLKFRGYYAACDKVDLVPNKNYFTMSQRGMQHCEFRAEPAYIKLCLKFIENMLISNAKVELESNEVEGMQRREMPFRNSDRSDSGLGNMWTLLEENEFD